VIKTEPVANETTNETRGDALNPVLGTGSLVIFGLAYLVPLAVFTTFGLVSKITSGHLPLAYLITTIAMMFTATSYASLVRNFPSAGSAYTYAKRAFGPGVGFITGWVLLLDYILLPAINYLIIGIYVHANFPTIPQNLVVLASIATVTILNVVGISIVRNVSLALVFGQLVFAGVFLTLAVTRANQDVSLLAPFYSDGLSWTGIFSGAAILCLSFLGFDAVSTLSEEARDARRTVPRAIILTTLVGGLIFVALSYAAARVVPDWQSIKASDSAAMEVMATLGGTVLTALFLAAFLAGCLASAVASQASVSRILFAMGRDGVLPRSVFGILDRRFNTPVRATLVVATVSTIVLIMTLDFLASIISFGALFAFSLVNLSVIKQFIVVDKLRRPKELLVYGLLPLIGLALTIWLWLSLSYSALAVGLGWFVIGMIYLMISGSDATPDAVRG
jgi:amino acid transporter